MAARYFCEGKELIEQTWSQILKKKLTVCREESGGFGGGAVCGWTIAGEKKVLYPEKPLKNALESFPMERKALRHFSGRIS